MNRDEPVGTHFVLLGANLDTGNLGVNALLVSTVMCLLEEFPSAKIYLFSGKRESMKLDFVLGNGQTVQLGCLGVRHNKTLWRSNHIVSLLLSALLSRFVPEGKNRASFMRRNEILNLISTAHAVADITGGDSFSDIYGLWRLFVGTLNKALIILCGQKLVLLPQTYGPYKTWLGQRLARWTLQRAERVFSRDIDSLAEINKVTGSVKLKSEPQFAFDMAFVLESIPPGKIKYLPAGFTKQSDKVTVGINVSGLLYNGGYSRNNMFGLKSDYPTLVKGIITHFLERNDTDVILIPHVFVRPGGVESDPDACRKILDELEPAYPGKIFMVEGLYDQCEIKHIIGQCDFFLGSRMHSCIAALSQGIPAVALAYSRKFTGVYSTIDQNELVLDMVTTTDYFARIDDLFERRRDISQKLTATMPEVKRAVRQTIQKSFQTLEVQEKA